MIQALTLSLPLSIVTPSLGETDTSRIVSDEIEQTQHLLQVSRSIGMGTALEELDSVVAETMEPESNDFDAPSCSRESVDLTRLLLLGMPPGSLQPRVSLDSDGLVTLEWWGGPRRVLLVTMGSDGSLHYAAMIGDERVFGAIRFRGEFPEQLADYSRRAMIE